MKSTEHSPDPSARDDKADVGDRGGTHDPDRVLFQIRESTIIQALRWIRQALGWLTAGYVVGLLIALLALERWGERSWLLSVALYAPAQLLLVPLLVLSPLCLFFRWRLLFWHLGAAAFLLFGFMTFRWSHVPKPSALVVTGVTFNYGECHRTQFMDFIQIEKPDFIVLQDKRGGAPELVKKIPGMVASNLGQFVLLSRFPIQKAEFVEAAKSGGQPVAVRWEVMIQNRATAIYGVHLPTPRHELSRFLGKRRILGDLVGYGKRQPGFGEYREWINERIELARALAEVFAQEQSPMIVAGDFNTPDHGYIYHLFAGKMTDAFTHAGRGWGLTFPGSTHNPVSLYGPWLRLDYFFVGCGWEAIECRPEPGQKSQHKAVLARFEPRPML